MLRFLSRWRPGHLLAAWSVYWLGLAAATVTPIMLAAHRASALGGPPNATDLNLSFSTSTGITVSITHLKHALFQWTAGPLTIALAIGLPPLLLWGAWLYERTRVERAPRRPAELGEGMPDVAPAERKSETVGR